MVLCVFIIILQCAVYNEPPKGLITIIQSREDYVIHHV